MNLDFIKNNRVILLFIFALLRNEYFCQEKKDSTYKWGVGLASTLNYSRFNYAKSSISGTIKNNFVMAPGINLIAKRSFSRFISIDFGLNYFRLISKIRLISTYSGIYTNQTCLDFLSAPLSLNYHIGNRRVNAAINLGVEVVMLANSIEKSKNSFYPEQTENNNYPTGQLAFYSSAGFKFNYHFNNRIIIFAGLNFHYGFQTFKQIIKVTGPDGLLEKKIDYFSLPIGIIYKF